MTREGRTLFVTTSGETNRIPELLECAVVRTLTGPNRSDYLLVNVVGSYRSARLVLATRHEGTSFFDLPISKSIAAYVIELKRDLIEVNDSLEREDVAHWTLGAV